MAKAKPIKEEIVGDKKRHYSMKIVAQVGSVDHIDWGWNSHKNRVKSERRFQIFDGIIALAAFLQFILVSYGAAFDPFNVAVLGICYFLDFLFTLDILASVYKCYRTDRRNVEFRKTNSRLNKFLRGLFILDIVALIPTEIIPLLMCSKLHSGTTLFQACTIPRVRYVRINRLISGYKIFRFLFKMESKVGAWFSVIRGLIYTAFTAMLLHGACCIWYLIACNDFSHAVEGALIRVYCSAPSWIYSGGATNSIKHHPPLGFKRYSRDIAPRPNKNLYAGFFDHGEGSTDYLLSLNVPYGQDIVRVNGTLTHRYFYALYWSVMTLTTVGIGEVHAITVGEMVFAMVIELVGMITLFGIVQGSVTSMIANFDTNFFQYRHRISAILDYLRDQNQSTELVRRVMDFYNYLWTRSNGLSRATLFDDLPFALRADIAMELCTQIIERSPLLQDLNTNFLRMLSLKFQPMLALPEQVIMKKGELSDIMVYIQCGELEVLSDDENEIPVLLLKPGKLFGEVNLITRIPRKFSVRAIAHCDLVVLRASDLVECLTLFPEIADELRQRAEERTGIIQMRIGVGMPALDTQEVVKRRKAQKELTAKMEELEFEIGVNLRPLMTALNIARPQETLKISDSMELFRIRDPMDEMVEYNMGSAKEQFNSRFRRLKQAFYDLSIDPDGKFYCFWERVLIMLVIITFFLNTYIGFFQSYRTLLQVPECGNVTDGVNYGARNSAIILILFDYLLDIFFIVDYGLKFVTQVNTPNGKITDHRSMAMAYIKSWGCYTDFLAVFPIEIFAAAAAGQGDCATSTILSILGYLKVNRALRVLTLPQFFDYLTTDLKNSITTVRTLKFVIYVTMMTQVCAVALYMTACDSESCDDSPTYTWTGAMPQPYMLKTIDPKYPNGVNGTMGYRYTTSLYYAVKLMTTVGYAELYPHNLHEQIVAGLVMLAGVLTYGYCLSVLTATLTNLEAPRVEFQNRLFCLISYMEFNKLAATTQQRVTESLALLWSISRGEDIPGVRSMTADMPAHLMEEIQIDDLVHLVAGVPIFKNIEESTLKLLAPAVRRYMFSPDEYIIQAGDLIPELFVIRRGYCHMFHPDQASVVIAVLHAGMYFGEIGFLFNRSEVVTVKAVTHCEILTLSRATFDDVAVNIHWLAHQINLLSEERSYYEELVEAAKEAKPQLHRRKQASSTRMSDSDKRKLRFREDLNAAEISHMGRLLVRFLINNTISFDSKFLKIWETIRVITVALQFVLIMLQVATQCDDLAMSGVLYVFDGLAWADIYIKLHVQYTNEMDIVVTHPYMTARRYLNGNFLLDVFCAVPCELLFLGVINVDITTQGREEVLHWMMYLRLNRLFQIYRIPLAFQYLESNIKIHTTTALLAKHLTYFIMYITFVACLPLVIQCPPLACALSDLSCYFPYPNQTVTDLSVALDIDTSQSRDFSDSSANTYFRSKRAITNSTPPAPNYGPIDSSGNVNIDTSFQCIDYSFLRSVSLTSNSPMSTIVIAAFYWAVTTTTTTGFGDMYATNQIEQIVFSLIMVSGVLFYGYIVACLAAMQINTDAHRARFFGRVLAISVYMNHEHLPKSLQKRVMRFYQYLWLRTQGIDPTNFISGLPPSLTGELALQLYRKVIDQTPIFKNTPLAFKKMVASIIRPLYVLEREYVTRIGDIGSDLYFLYRGSVEVQYRTGEFSPTIIRSGRILGEVAFLTNQKGKCSYRARENSDLFYLGKREFEVVLDHFPDVRDKLMEEARETMELEAEHHRINDGKVRRPGDKQSIYDNPHINPTFKDLFNHWKDHVFPSTSLFIRYYHKFGMAFIRTISILLIIYQIGFTDVLDVVGFMTVNYLFEMFMFFDIFVTLRAGFLDEYGNEVTDISRIQDRYVKNCRSGLLMDILTLLPYELLCLCYVNIWPLLWAYLRIIRVPFRAVRISQFFAEWLNELDINLLGVRLTHSFVQLGIWMHVFTCIAFFIGTCSIAGIQTSWLRNTVLVADGHTPVERYFVTLYWIVNTATTTGYGDIIPLTDTGRILCIAIQIVGRIVFGFIIASIASALVNSQSTRQDFECQYQTMKRYLVDQRANKGLILRVQDYFNFLWQVGRGIHDIKNIITDAPFCLRTELTYAVHHRDLRQLSIFRDSSDAFIRMLSACLHQIQFVPGDYIIQQGDLVKELYLLHRGEAVEIETGVEIGVIRHGSHINWQAILIDWPASRTVRATDNCEVYMLSRDDLNAVIEKFKHEMDHICSSTRNRLRELLVEENEELDNVNSLPNENVEV